MFRLFQPTQTILLSFFITALNCLYKLSYILHYLDPGMATITIRVSPIRILKHLLELPKINAKSTHENTH